MKRSRRYSAGFTLIELMIVVAIIAVLALLGIAGYGRIIRTSHSAEARQMIGAIKIAHESRRAETGSFAQPSNGSLANFCPAGVGAGSGTKYAWNPGCQAWNTIPVQSDGPVLFQYASVSGVAGAAPPALTVNGVAITWPAPTLSDWYVTVARLDENNDGTFCRATGSSFTNEIVVENEGD
jgi:prepilin-type N-terminal cleavage/methylation domain-containing protein